MTKSYNNNKLTVVSVEVGLAGTDAQNLPPIGKNFENSYNGRVYFPSVSFWDKITQCQEVPLLLAGLTAAANISPTGNLLLAQERSSCRLNFF